MEEIKNTTLEEISNNVRKIKNWVVFWSVLTIIGGVVTGIILALTL